MKGLRYIISVFVLIVFIFLSFNEKGHSISSYFKTGNDTLKAQVSYGDRWLIDECTFIDREILIYLIDSISQNRNAENFHQFCFLKKAINSSYQNRIAIVDSLLAVEQIPYELVNEINRYTAYYSYEEDYDPQKESSIHDDFFPGQNTYGDNWNIHHPFNYPELISPGDSLVRINFKSKASKYYHHPVSEQTIRKYGGRVESPFGWRDGKRHNGVDIPLDRWDTIYNAFDGKVRMAKNYSGYGKVVIVRHYNGLETLYAHLQQIKVKTGQEIKAGTVVGLGGSTGNSTGSHLHLEIRYKGIALNPGNIIDFNNKKLLSDTLIIKRDKNTLIGIPAGIKFHVVERGDYPLKIAQRYGISIQDLCKMNNLSARTRLRIGQQLRVSE